MTRVPTSALLALPVLLLACGPSIAPFTPGGDGSVGLDEQRPGGQADAGTLNVSKPAGWGEGAPALGADGGAAVEEPPDPLALGQWPEIQSQVPTYALHVASSDLATLENNLSHRDLLVPATFTHAGRSWAVKVRYRGRSSRYLPKKSFQVRFADEDPFLGGVKRLELLAAWKDGGLLTEKLWYDLAHAFKVRVPRVKYVNLDLNGARYGVMVEIEALKKTFLEPHGFDDDSDIYRCGMHDCELRSPPQASFQEAWDKRTNESRPWDPLWAFLEGLEQTPPHAFAGWLGQKLDLEGYLRWLAVDAAISNSTIDTSRSFLIRDADRNRWSYVPWDLNNALSLYNRLNGPSQFPNYSRPLRNYTIYDPHVYELAQSRAASGELPEVTPLWSVLSTRLLDDPSLRSQLVDRIRRLVEERFTEEQLGERAEALKALLAPHLAQDPWVDDAFVTNSAAFVRSYVKLRRGWLLGHLDELESHGDSDLTIDRVGFTGGGGLFVDLHNASSSAKDLSGHYLTGNLRAPGQARLGAVSLGAGERVRLTGSSLPAGFQANPERLQIALFGPDGRTALDVLYLPALGAGEAYGRTSPGTESFGPMQP